MMLMLSHQKQEQNGFVSIIVASILMVILALITIGFTQIMQREQRQALDRQLSRQALYAAESGVNDVLSAIADGTYTAPTKSDCDVSGLGVDGNGTLDAESGTAYTCATYDKAPGELVYDVGTSQSKIVQFSTASGNSFSSINVEWGNADTDNNDVALLPNCGIEAETLPGSRNTTVPVLKFDLTDASSYGRDALINGSDYLFLVPCKNGTPPGTHMHNPAVRGSVVQVPCSASGDQPCRVVIDGLNVSNRFLGRFRPVYTTAAVTITGEEAIPSGGTQVTEFDDAQVSVDVTAKVSDVVRRLRVTAPYTLDGPIPEAAVQAFDGVCKLLNIISDVPPVNLWDDCDYDNPTPPPYTPPPSPPVSACPTTSGSTATAFTGGNSLSNIAFAAAGGNENSAAIMIDVLYSIDPTKFNLRWTNPDLDLGAAIGSSTFRVADDCQYRVNYTVFCGASTSAIGGTWGQPPPTSVCLSNQVNEGYRANFYSDNNSGQCGGALLAYFDVPDHFVGSVSSSVHSASAPVTLTGNTGTINCMELEAACAVLGGHVGCTQPGSTQDSSIYMHEFEWIEEPA